jgi:hypothetical protein
MYISDQLHALTALAHGRNRGTHWKGGSTNIRAILEEMFLPGNGCFSARRPVSTLTELSLPRGFHLDCRLEVSMKIWWSTLCRNWLMQYATSRKEFS